MGKKVQEQTELESLESLSTKQLLAKINYRLGLRSTALRGFVYGVFQFLGATVGVAILFFIFARILHGIERLPLLGDNQIVQIVLNEVEKQNPQVTDIDNPTEE